MALPLIDAQERGVCRICGEPLLKDAKNLPAGWRTMFREQVWPDKITLNFGEEFAHTDCLAAAPEKGGTELMSVPKIQPRDKHGRLVEIGDVLKVFHFTGRRWRKKWYMYKVVVRVGAQFERDRNGWWCAVSASQIAKDGELKSACRIDCLGDFEIVQGYGPGDILDYADRPKELS